MANTTDKLVHCRYPKCLKLHQTTELKKENAVQGGNRNYYHPDCWDMMQSVNRIKSTFCESINTKMTGKQIGQLVSIINNIIFEKGIEPGLIEFALDYFIKYKPGKLRFPGGLHYIVQDRDVTEAWAREQNRIFKSTIKNELQKQSSTIDNLDDFDLLNNFHELNNNKKSKFSSVLGV